MHTYNLIKRCKICSDEYIGFMCDCERNSHRGWRIWTRHGHAYGEQYGVTANARTVKELCVVIDHHIRDREEWFKGRAT